MRIETVTPQLGVDDIIMPIGARVYEMIIFSSKYKELNANLGQDDAVYILGFQNQEPETKNKEESVYQNNQIPVRFQDLEFAFPDWVHPGDSEYIAHLVCRGHIWVIDWYSIESCELLKERIRLLRRIL